MANNKQLSSATLINNVGYQNLWRGWRVLNIFISLSHFSQSIGNDLSVYAKKICKSELIEKKIRKYIWKVLLRKRNSNKSWKIYCCCRRRKKSLIISRLLKLNLYFSFPPISWMKTTLYHEPIALHLLPVVSQSISIPL